VSGAPTTCVDYWIERTYVPQIEAIVIPNYLIPFTVALIAEIIIYVRIGKYLRKSFDAKRVYELIWYPLVLLLCWGPGVIYWIVMRVSGKEVVPLVYMHFFLSTAQGFFNALIYGFTYQVKEVLKRRYRSRSERTLTIQRSSEGSLGIDLSRSMSIVSVNDYANPLSVNDYTNPL